MSFVQQIPTTRHFRIVLLFLSVVTALLFYWSYLAFVTQPIFVYDAKGYQDLGIFINQQGWKAYFVTGPNREPMYPFFIAWTMRLAGQISYLAVLKSCQVFLLFMTVILFFVLLQRGHVSKKIMVGAVFYLGVSPALVNSALSVYSEIVTYVFILGIILVGSIAWQKFAKGSTGQLMFLGLALGALFVAIALAKGIYEMIFPLFLFPFGVWAFAAWKRGEKNLFRNIGIFLFSASIIFLGGISGYKALNKKYNGLFSLTDRGAWAMYGNTARRQEPLTSEKFLAGAAYNLFEEDGCGVFFNKELCHFWDVATSDGLSAQKNAEVTKEFSAKQRDYHFAKLILAKIAANPLQYILLMSFDWVHMFFWESTRIGFVVYPDWLDMVFDWAPFAKGLRFVVGLLSLTALIFAASFLCRNKRLICKPEEQSGPFMSILFLSVYLIVCHVTLYALFATVPRFAFPVVPLIILVIAFSAQIFFGRKSFKRTD